MTNDPIQAAIDAAKAEALKLAGGAGAPAPAGAPAGAPAVEDAAALAARYQVTHYPGYRYNPTSNAYDAETPPSPPPAPVVAQPTPPAPPAPPMAPPAPAQHVDTTSAGTSAGNAWTPPPQPAPAQAPQAYAGSAPIPPANPTPIQYNVPVVAQVPANMVPAMPRAAGKPISMERVAAEKSQMAIDYFLAISEHGITVKFRDEDPNVHLKNQIIPFMQGVIDFSEIQIFYGLRFERVKGQFTYYRTFDGVKDEAGVDWNLRIQEVKQFDPSSRGDYPGANVVVTLTQPAMSLTGQQVLPAGAKVGFSTAVTNWGAWKAFYNSCLAHRLVDETPDGQMSGDVEIRLGFVAKHNKGKNWGLFSFQILDDVSDPPPATGRRRTARAAKGANNGPAAPPPPPPGVAPQA